MKPPPNGPCATDASQPAKRGLHAPQRILVVDDDTNIRELCFQVLIGSGYRVDTAEDGEVGWRVLHAVRHDPDSYDLLITDNNMPRLTGLQLIKRLLAARMKVPVILASGSTPEEVESLQLAAVLPKPFAPAELLEAVAEVLRPDRSDPEEEE